MQQLERHSFMYYFNKDLYCENSLNSVASTRASTGNRLVNNIYKNVLHARVYCCEVFESGYSIVCINVIYFHVALYKTYHRYICSVRGIYNLNCCKVFKKRSKLPPKRNISYEKLSPTTKTRSATEMPASRHTSRTQMAD